MAPSDKIVIDDDFIQKVHDTLDTCATTLADMWLRPVPRFNSVKVAAGADGYVPERTWSPSWPPPVWTSTSSAAT